MGWFDEQIRQRKLSDQEILEDSMLHMASVVLGKRRADHLYDEGIAAREAIDEILKYYRSPRASRIWTNSWNTVCAPTV